jgi:Protein of unknown function (DUF2852)
MYQADPSFAASGGIASWPARAEAWLDARGRKAWIIAMVLGFIFFWPVGLGLLAYMIWSKRMFSRSCGKSRHDRHKWREGYNYDYRYSYGTSGNTAFDAYKSDTLKRLEEEQKAFESFLQRLRDAKDKSEFDSFMEDRARSTKPGDDTPEAKGEY